MNTYIKLFTNDLKNKGLSLYDKAVFGSLVTKYQYHEGNEFYTYEAYIADELEISESSVKRSIKKLTELGLISIRKKFHKQFKQTVNYYSINLDNDTEDLNTDTKILEPSTATTQSAISEPETNNEGINKVEEIEHIITSINNNETAYETGLQDIHNRIGIMREEVISINKGIENYDTVNSIIEQEFNQTAEEYFRQFNTMFDLGFNNLEHISELSGFELTPDDVLNVYKAIKKKQAA